MWETEAMFCYLIDCCAISPLTEVPWGRAEKADSGVDKIVSGWKYLGWPLPTVAEETRPDYVVLTMRLGAEPDKKTTQENTTRKSNKQELRREQILEFCVTNLPYI